MFTRNSTNSERLADPSRRRLFSGKIKAKQVMRLPWVINETAFTSGCNQCQDCMTACETNIIVKDELGFPKVDFTIGECSFCNQCIDVCQQPLFVSPSEDRKPWPMTLEIGDKCLAKNNIYCQSCRDECETNVIKFNYVNSSIPTPSLNDVDCIQCGACISSCPQSVIKFSPLHNEQNQKEYL